MYFLSLTRMRKESMSPELYRTMATRGQLWIGTGTPHPSPPPPPSQEQNQPKAVVTLLYIRHLSESIRGILNPLGIRTCFHPYQNLRWTLVHLKDRIPLQQRSGVVFRITCRTCTKVYIGQTGAPWSTG